MAGRVVVYSIIICFPSFSFYTMYELFTYGLILEAVHTKCVELFFFVYT